jgi:hypothetical protein
MNRKFLAILPFFALTGCTGLFGPVEVVHKTGSSFAQRQQAVDECKIASFQSIPQAMVTEVSPGISSTPQTQCTTDGNQTLCVERSDMIIPPQVTTRDANAGLRSRFVNRCLQSKGFDMIERPICTKAQDRAAWRATRDNQPSANQIVCVGRENL